jgi:hypothetical protein
VVKGILAVRKIVVINFFWQIFFGVVQPNFMPTSMDIFS